MDITILDSPVRDFLLDILLILSLICLVIRIINSFF